MFEFEDSGELLLLNYSGDFPSSSAVLSVYVWQAALQRHTHSTHTPAVCRYYSVLGRFHWISVDADISENDAVFTEIFFKTIKKKIGFSEAAFLCGWGLRLKDN